MLQLLGLVLPVFALIALGVALARLRVIDEAGAKAIGDICFIVAAPALLFRLIANAEFPSMIPWGFWIAYFAGMAVVWIAGMVLARSLFRLGSGDAVMAGLATAQANTVMIGIPIVLKAYGDQAAFPIAMLLAVNLPLTMLAATLLIEGSRASGGARSFAGLAKSLITHPILIGIVAGTLAHAVGYRPAGAAGALIDMVAAMAIPLSLLSLGLSLARTSAFANIPVALMISGLKLIMHPGVAYLLSHHVFALPPAWTGTAVLFAAMPAGINSYLFAVRYGQGVGLVSTAVAVSTALSVVSSLFWLWILGIG